MRCETDVAHASRKIFLHHFRLLYNSFVYKFVIQKSLVTGETTPAASCPLNYIARWLNGCRCKTSRIICPSDSTSHLNRFRTRVLQQRFPFTRLRMIVTIYQEVFELWADLNLSCSFSMYRIAYAGNRRGRSPLHME